MPTEYQDTKWAWGATTLFYVVLPLVTVAASVSNSNEMAEKTESILDLWQHLDKLGFGPPVLELVHWKKSYLDPEFTRKLKSLVINILTTLASDELAKVKLRAPMARIVRSSPANRK